MIHGLLDILELGENHGCAGGIELICHGLDELLVCLNELAFWSLNLLHCAPLLPLLLLLLVLASSCHEGAPSGCRVIPRPCEQSS